jgi:hypothetical protein
MDYLSVSEVARRLGVKPKTISDLFYQRELRDDLCPIIGGRRLIPRDYVVEVEQALVERGFLPESKSTAQIAARSTQPASVFSSRATE